MLLSVINNVINDYYHPELIKLYRKILIDLDFEVTGQHTLFNYKKLDYLKFDNKKMVLVDENQNFATNNKIIFNPIADNISPKVYFNICIASFIASTNNGNKASFNVLPILPIK
mgnify:CR=1 FL=1